MFDTVTVVVALPMLPAASLAVAEIACKPFDNDVVFSELEYGADVNAAPSALPSTLNWTLATPTLSDALAVIEIVPVTVELLAGAVMETMGAIVSFVATVFETVTLTDAVAEFPAAS